MNADMIALEKDVPMKPLVYPPSEIGRDHRPAATAPWGGNDRSYSSDQSHRLKYGIGRPIGGIAGSSSERSATSPIDPAHAEDEVAVQRAGIAHRPGIVSRSTHQEIPGSSHAGMVVE